MESRATLTATAMTVLEIRARIGVSFIRLKTQYETSL